MVEYLVKSARTRYIKEIKRLYSKFRSGEELADEDRLTYYENKERISKDNFYRETDDHRKERRYLGKSINAGQAAENIRLELLQPK